MWFWLSVAALLCWSASDLFSKIGCRDAKDRYAPLKMVIAVGTVMGLHAAFEILADGVQISWHVIWSYLPVSLLYIGSMLLGYLGLRYIELSVSSPICNSSGALVAILALLTGEAAHSAPMLLAVSLICAGVIGLGAVEAREDEALRAARQEASNYRYAKSWLALALPVAYCLLDAAGTFADNRVLETLDEDAANCAYELTFLLAALVCAVYVFVIRKDKPTVRGGAPRYIGAVFETVGQLAYIYAIADAEHLAMSAPIISAYCAVSVLWSRIFLKERLSRRHYAMIGLVLVGIVVLGMLDL